MKVYGINSNYSTNNKAYNSNFTGYYEILHEGARTPIKNLDHAQYLFDSLINEINYDKLIIKNQFFDAVKKICTGSKLKELFNKLKQPEQENPVISYIINALKKENVVSIANNNYSVFDMISLSGKQKDIHLGFSAGKRKGYIEFYTDKKGDIFVDRVYGKDMFSTGFYSDTGTKKIEIESYAGEVPDRTYYNKDGSKPFFKNLFLGGTPVEGIY